MKKIVSISFMLVIIGMNAQQIPWTVQEGPETFNTGTAAGLAPYEFHMPLLTPGPVLYMQDINGDVTAGERVHLGPGFRSGNFSNSTIFNPYFHAQIGASADFEIVYLQPNSHYPQVGQFEKLEMGIRLPANIEQQVDAFLNNQLNGTLNPFDPEQISIEATFQNGWHSYTVYGFYYDEFIRDPATMTVFAPANWLPQNTDYHWRIRFSPPFLGQWKCSVAIRIGNASTYAYAVNGLSFNCVSSSNPGYLKVGNDDRHLIFSGTNESFFALGQNICWNDGIYFRGEIPATNPRAYTGGFLDVLDWIKNLSDQGGNMVRICTIGWSFELEPYRLNNYSDRLNHEWELDRLFELCEQKHLMISFSFADRRFANSTDQTNPLMNWENNPYHTQLTGIDYPDDFLTNPAAISIFSKKLRYFMARYGYSTSLGLFAPMGEINGGYSGSHPTDQTKLYNWFSSMFGLAKNLTAYRPLITFTSYGDHQEIGNPTPFELGDCDITTVHSYHNQRNSLLMMNEELNKNVGSDQGTLHRWDHKPSYVEEMGICPDPNCGADPNDIEGCSDITYHNSLWATAFMGGLGTGFVWWQWFNNDYREANYPALHAFFDGIDFQSTRFNNPDFWDDARVLDENHSSSTIETFYLRDDGRDRVMGWVHNPTHWWGNIDNECEDRNGNVMSPINLNDDDPSVPQTLSVTTEFEIHGINNLSHYTVDIYNTRFNGGIYQTQNVQSNILGTLKPHYPGFAADYAFKAYRPGNNFRLTDEISYDTLRCEEDTVEARGKHEMDTLNIFLYHWDFGNGQASDERNAIVVYDYPGTYLVTLVVSDSLGWSDTLRQYIVKPNCESSRIKNAEPEGEHNSSWFAYPNPASAEIRFEFDSSWQKIIQIEIYSTTGQCLIRQTTNSSSPDSIRVEALASGFYILRIKDARHSEDKKIIINHE